jgi:hypothetical protein
MKSERLPVALVLATYRPTDMMDEMVPIAAPLADQWAACFRSIVENHHSCDSKWWAAFNFSVCKRQREPIRLSRARRTVENGHHRLHALSAGGITTVRVQWVKDSPQDRELNRLLRSELGS